MFIIILIECPVLLVQVIVYFEIDLNDLIGPSANLAANRLLKLFQPVLELYVL